MNTASWISSQVSRLLPPSARLQKGKTIDPSVSQSAGNGLQADAQPRAVGDAAGSSTRQGPVQSGLPASRSTRERLQGRVRKADEALSPRELRQRLEELRAVIDPHVSEVEGGRRALALARCGRQAP